MSKNFVGKITGEKITPAQVETFFLLSIGAAKEIGKVQYSKSDTDAKPKITTDGSRSFYDSSQKITDQTIVGIGSISKQFTAATLMKLWDNELSQKKSTPQIKTWFGKGMNTPLQDFMPLLKNKYKCDELFSRIEADENYSKITLRDLLNHTHGLGARDDDKAVQLVRDADGRPLDLEKIANITKKREGEKYGEHLYGNFGYDLAAMIIEAVAQEKNIANSFDEAVKELVLKPNGLKHTHPQSDHIDLYKPGVDVATGYAIDSSAIDKSLSETKDSRDVGEYKMNGTSNTRAAGGFKSNVADLAKFASLYMGAEMFVSDEVKAEILDREKGAKPNPEQPQTYHLGIQTFADGSIGHNGTDIIFSSELRFNPQNKATRVELKVEETLTDYVTRRVFNNLYPNDAKKLDDQNFWKDCKFSEKFEAAGRPEPFGEKGKDVIRDALYSSPETCDIIQRYIAIKEEVSKIPGQELVDKREDFVQKLSDQFKDVNKACEESFVNRVGLDAIKPGHVARAKAAFENNDTRSH